MGLIRGGFVFFLGVLLFLSFLAVNIFATLSSSLEYDNVKEQIIPLVNGFGNSDSKISQAFGAGEFNLSQTADDVLLEMQISCQNNPNITSYNFSYGGRIITIPCETLFEAGGKDAIINKTVSGFIDSFYYQDYNCGFFDCLQEDKLPLFLVSAKAKDYWQGKFYFAIIASVVLIVLMILFMENRINAPIILGILLALSAFPILKLSSLISAIAGQPISFIIGIFFSNAGMIFWISFIIGLALIGAGFASKVMNLGFIKNLIQKKPEAKQSQETQTKSSSPAKAKKKK